jgi:uncharacterized membrane protein YdjX (TVP38/TMEM64 family)
LGTPLTPRGLRNLRIAAVLAVLTVLFVAQRLGVFAQFRDPARLQHTLVELGPRGYLAFVVAYACFQPFGIPGTVFVMVAPLIWPWPIAFALSMTGTMAASVVGFSFARFVARDWVSGIIPARFRKYEERLERRGFATVFLLRLVFWMPPLLHAFFGVSRVRFWTHFWASFLGYLPPLFLMSYFGERLFHALRSLPPSSWLLVLATVVTVALATWWWRRRGAAVQAAQAVEASSAD